MLTKKRSTQQSSRPGATSACMLRRRIALLAGSDCYKYAAHSERLRLNPLVDLAKVRYLVRVEYEVGALADEFFGLVAKNVQDGVGNIFICRLCCQITCTGQRSMHTHIFIRGGHDQGGQTDARRGSIASG